MLRQIRATRSRPPGKAGSNRERRATYSAALEQFDSLIRSARVAVPAARPLPLFYALSQGGRAILAAHGPGTDWNTRGHGLVEGSVNEPILRSTIALDRRRPGLFAAVAGVTGSCVFGGRVELGQLWAALPTEAAYDENGRWTPALQVWPRMYSKDPVEHMLGSGGKATVLLRKDGVSPEDLTSLLRRYPMAEGAVPIVAQGIWSIEETPFGFGYPVAWREEGTLLSTQDLLWRIPLYRFPNEHWLLPGIGSRRSPMTPLMLWWALLFGLSLLARYQSAEWVSALDPDESVLTVPVEELMDEALEAVPHVLFEALVDRTDLVGRR